MNTKIVFNAVKNHPSSSITELAKVTKLNRMTVSRELHALLMCYKVCYTMKGSCKLWKVK